MFDLTDDKALLDTFVRLQRAAIIAKVEGLDDGAARARLVPSLTTPVGIVNHCAGVERWWLRVQFAGEQDVPLPWTRDDPDADFRAEGVTLEQAIADFRQAAEESAAIIAASSLDDRAAKVTRQLGEPATLRWILLHLVEEYARHAGHADILREQLDARG